MEVAESRLTGWRASPVSRAEALARGPLAFWFLNHELEKGELLRQMQELKAKGFAGFFLHPRGGLRVPYGPQGSGPWRDMIQYCVQEARALGLEAWLYDEDPYPSGTAGGRVTLERPEFRATELAAVIETVVEEGRVEVDLPAGMLIAVYLVDASGERVERLNDAAGIIRSKWHQRFTSIGYYPPYQAADAPHWRAETVDPYYRIFLNSASAGSRIVAFVRKPVVQNPWGEYTDMLNAEAVKLFVEYTHDAYAELLGAECGATVPGVFTDEAKLKGRLPWSQRVPEWFREITGVALLEILPHLVMKLDERTPYYRWAYRKALAVGLHEAAVEPLVAACRRHRLLLTGHVSPEEDPAGQVIFVPGLMGVIGRMDLPGTDLIGAMTGSREHPLLHLSPKLASSAAHGYGKRQITCEAFAVCDWAQDFGALTRALHWLYALGVNRLVTHGQFYSIDGLRKREAPPSQFIQASYWEHFGAFSAMVELLSRELGSGEHEAPLLVYYPEESFMATVSGLAEEEAEVLEMREELGTLVHALLTEGYDFDFADEELLLSAEAEEGRARLQAERFDAVVVPGRFLSVAAWEQFQRLQAQGVRVLYPQEEMTVLAASPRRWKTGGGSAELWERLRREVRPLWQAEGSLIGHLRRTESGPLLFLSNNERRDFCGLVNVCFTGPYSVCHPQEGIWRSMDRLDLRLGPGLGVLIRQERGEFRPARYKEIADHARWGEWRCTPQSENCLTIGEFCVLHSPGNWKEPPGPLAFGTAPVVDLLSPTSLDSSLATSPGDRYFHAGFDWRAGDAPVRLVCDSDLGEGTMEFYLNGQRLPEPVRRSTYDPMNREVDLAPFIISGRNHLLWVQRCGAAGGRVALPYDGLRLFGDFHVEFPYGRPMPACLTPRPEYYATGFPVPASQMGHPHYGGLIAYESELHLSGNRPGRAILEVERVFESMEVRINGATVGWIWSAPWRVEFPGEMLLPGANRVALICSCSPAAYLQALPRPSGFLGPIRLYGSEA